MHKAQGVANFVRRKLPQAGKCQLEHGVIVWRQPIAIFGGVVRGKQAFSDQVILSHAQ